MEAAACRISKRGKLGDIPSAHFLLLRSQGFTDLEQQKGTLQPLCPQQTPHSTFMADHTLGTGKQCEAYRQSAAAKPAPSPISQQTPLARAMGREVATAQSPPEIGEPGDPRWCQTLQIVQVFRSSVARHWLLLRASDTEARTRSAAGAPVVLLALPSHHQMGPKHL